MALLHKRPAAASGSSETTKSARKSSTESWTKHYSKFSIKWKTQAGRYDLAIFVWHGGGQFFQISTKLAGSDEKCWSWAEELAVKLDEGQITDEQLRDERGKLV